MLEWIQENWWVVWLVLAGGLAVSEMLTLDMTLLMLAGGALAGAGAAMEWVLSMTGSCGCQACVQARSVRSQLRTVLMARLSR